MEAKQFEAIIKELDQIKRLLVIQLLLGGADGGTIGHALGIKRSRVSQLFPINKFKKLQEK